MEKARNTVSPVMLFQDIACQKNRQVLWVQEFKVCFQVHRPNVVNFFGDFRIMYRCYINTVY